MPRTIYSKRLWSQSNTASSGTTVGPLVPQGFVWDLRDIVATNSSFNDGTLVPDMTILVNGTLTVFRTPVGTTLAGVPYHEELRFIVYPTDVLEQISNAAAWSWSISGYELVA